MLGAFAAPIEFVVGARTVGLMANKDCDGGDERDGDSMDAHESCA
jgi:hypothetical protein